MPIRNEKSAFVYPLIHESQQRIITKEADAKRHNSSSQIIDCSNDWNREIAFGISDGVPKFFGILNSTEDT